ncbi:MAG: hypothetical protein II852_06995 [Bacteroidales bacterium]|nr:hypothetical protein [Bacteroidales bacterium]
MDKLNKNKIMKDFIEPITREISTKAAEISNALTNKINALKWNDTDTTENNTQQTVRPNNTLNLVGGVLIAGGVIGMIATEAKIFSALVAIAGAGVLCYGYLQTKNAKPENTEPKVNLSEVRNYFIDRIQDYVDSADKDWSNYMEGVKAKVQAAINSSSLTDDEKSSAMNHTYITKTLSINTIDLIGDFKSCTSLDEAMNVKFKFAETVAEKISAASTSQVAEYAEI